MSLRTLGVLLLAVICGVSAAVGMMRLNHSAPPAPIETAPVVVAKVEIARGTMVGADMLELRDWPKQMVPENCISKIEEATDRSSLVQILAGDLMLKPKLADKDAGRGLAPLIPAGLRAYTIQTSKVAANVAGLVLPGNRVDVLLTLKGDETDGTGGGSSTTLLQAVEILAIDQQLDAPANNKTADLRSVTLLVTPRQAAFLDLGQNLGQLTLSLRNPKDTDEAETLPATLADLRFKQEPVENMMVDLAPPPAQPPVRRETIRTLRGSQTGEVSVSLGR